ncbi:MAG: basic amino acid ABC transporter substrate-binding protein [Actinomycetota bacterium]|nr:basic amino acid ABC transporter substrate-binding protein [Actinomycetota bacterium]
MSRKGILNVLVLLFAVTLVAALFVAGCGEEEETKTEDMTEETEVTTNEEGKLLVGSDTTYPPFESIDAGEAVGFDIDIAAEIADRLGLELQVETVAWEGIISGLKTGKYDILMSAMTITPEREDEIDFCDPYIDSNQSICVAMDNEDITGPEDLVDKIVGVQVETTGQYTAEEIEGIAEIRKYETILLAFEDLELGRIDAIMNDFPVNAWLSGERGKTKVVDTIQTDESYGIGVKKGNDALKDAINEALEDMKADGTYDEIYEKWFGTEETTG